MKRIVILASGSGSNAENIINYFSGNDEIQFPVILSNKADAYVRVRAEKLNVPFRSFDKEQMANGELLQIIKEQNPDIIVLAGFLPKVPSYIIEAFPNKIINIHPSLLPKFGGKGMYGMHVHEAVVAAREKESGISIHYVNENLDEGAIIFQAKCEVNPTDSAEDVAQKVHALEYEYLPKIIETLL